MSAEGLAPHRPAGPRPRIRAQGWAPAAVGGLTMGADPWPTRSRWRAGSRRRSSTRSVSARRPRSTAPGGGSRATSGAGDAVVVVEDVITSGGSALQAIEAVEEAGGRVLGVLAVVDREEGGRAALAARGHGVSVLTTVTELGLR